jgi:hypothetical protein
MSLLAGILPGAFERRFPQYSVTPMKRPIFRVFSLILTLTLLSSGQAALSFEAPVSYATGHVPEAMVSGNLNGDVYIDIAVANTSADYNPGGNNVTVFLGGAGGVLSAGTNYPVGMRPESLVLCKADSDETLDIVTSNFGDELTPGDGSLSVLLGNGDGTFAPEIRIDVPYEPRTVVAADFDGDGKTDLATANYDFDSISIYLGDGTGSFALTNTIAVGNQPEHLAVLRLDDDEIPDLVVANRLDRNFTPLAGDGTGNFDDKPVQPVGRWPRFVFARDLDGDGLDDVIVSNYLDNNVLVQRNRGDYTFELKLDLSYADLGVTFEWPLEIDLADITGDGHDDLLVTWAASNNFTVSPGSAVPFDFQPSLAVQTGTIPVGIEAVDLDKDGAIDVVVAAAGDDKVNVFLSSRADIGTVVDNDKAGTSFTGTWNLSVAPFFYGTNSLYCSTGGEYRWEADLPEPGYYEVYLWWTVTPDRESAAAVRVEHLEGVADSTVDQKSGYGYWHSLGTFLFRDTGAVVLTSQGAGAESVSADAARFRLVTPAPAGRTLVTASPKPDHITLEDNKVIAFQGSLEVQNDLESNDWSSATFAPIGEGEESTRITEARLYVDSNGNHKYDITDLEIGSAETFPSETGPLTFNGFQRQLASGSSLDFFVICTVEPASVVRSPALSGPGRPALAMAFVLALLPIALRKRKDLMRLCVLAFLLAPLCFFVAGGCGGGGGGGGGDEPPPPAEALQIQMTSLTASGSSTGVPATVGGLPLDGWTF